MISVTVSGHDAVFEYDLSSYRYAYVDGDWLPETGRRDGTPALLTDGQTLTWLRQTTAVPDGVDADAAAGSIMARAARDAIERLGDTPARVAVTGHGAIAAAARSALGVQLCSDEMSGPPDAWIECSGTVDALRSATRTVQDMGIVVLVGEPADEPVELDLYRDVHLRGLRLVGVPLRLEETSGERPVRDERTLPPLFCVRGSCAPGRHAWYRLEAESVPI
jgi:hypothetical protein